jgi:hypothetical protein
MASLSACVLCFRFIIYTGQDVAHASRGRLHYRGTAVQPTSCLRIYDLMPVSLKIDKSIQGSSKTARRSRPSQRDSQAATNHKAPHQRTRNP